MRDGEDPEEPEDPAVEKSALNEKIAEAEALVEEDYTEDTWGPFETALENAITVADNEDATQDEVNDALTELTTAMDALEEKPEEPAVDKTALNVKIVEAEALIEEDYTEETWGPFETALANAIAVAANEDETQQEVDDALAALTTAMEALEEKPEEPVVVTVVDIQEDAVVDVGIPGILSILIIEENMTNFFDGITTETTFNVAIDSINITLVYSTEADGWIPDPIVIRDLTQAQVEAGIVTIND